MSSILKNGTRCVIVAGCPENIGLLVVTTEHLGAYDGSEDAYRITTLSGRPFPQLNRRKRILKNHSNVAITDRYKLRPLVDPKAVDPVREAETPPARRKRFTQALEVHHAQ